MANLFELLILNIRLVLEYTGVNMQGYSPPILDMSIKFLCPFVNSGERRK